MFYDKVGAAARPSPPQVPKERVSLKDTLIKLTRNMSFSRRAKNFSRYKAAVKQVATMTGGGGGSQGFIRGLDLQRKDTMKYKESMSFCKRRRSC